MAHAAAAGDSGLPNHPHAPRMGAIAAVAHNMIVGCVMGSFGVMVASISARTGMDKDTALLGGPLVMLGSAIAAPLFGDLVARRSLRLMMLAGAVMALVGFVLLAFVATPAIYFIAYLALFGPAMAITGSIGPATLVTRWFDRHRGLALGLVHLNLIVAVMPPLCNWLLESSGDQGALAVYLMMAALVGVVLMPAILAVRDFPPDAPAAAGAPAAAPVEGLTLGQIARQPTFWLLATTASAIIAGIMVLTFSMVTMAEGMGYTRAQGAFLQTVMSLAGMVGSILFGWVADRLGGFRGLALIAFNFAVLLSLLLLDLPYGVLVGVIALLGLHGAGMVPNVSRALAGALGPSSFSRAFGLSSFLSVPFTAAGVFGMSVAHGATGSYTPAIAGLIVLLLVAATLPLIAARRAA